MKKENIEVKQSNALKGFLFRAYHAGSFKTTSVEDPEQQPLRMTSLCHACGFSLIELLVVVLIIGILAAIAVPQFQMAIARTRFAELKVQTKYVAQFAQDYYLTHSTYEGATAQLIKEQARMGYCNIWVTSTTDYVRCCKKISNVNTCMYFTRSTGKPLYCLVFSTNATDMANKLCKQETGKSTGIPYKESGSAYITYSY